MLDNHQSKPHCKAVPKNPFIGVVTDCVRLNVRKEPKEDAEILAVINALSTVSVDLEESTEFFCKVCTPDGVEGFCMKKYIQLRR